MNAERNSKIASYFLIAALVLFLLYFRLIGPAIIGMIVYSVSTKIAYKIEEKFELHKIARTISVGFIVAIISCLITFAIFGLFHLFKEQSETSFSWLFLTAADILEKARASLPQSISSYIPDSVDHLKAQLIILLKSNGHALGDFGFRALHGIAGSLVGIIIGSMLAFHNFKKPEEYNSFSKALLERFITLRQSFDKVVLAQMYISLLNTIFTAIYLLAILPLFGIHLPLTKTMIILTFVAGLIPVIGNLISNFFIVAVSIGVSFHVGIASLVFLVVIHKFEYFLNAHIIGHKVNAVAWELLLAMFFMEILFGLPGVISAPVLYAYIKQELKDNHLIGSKKQALST